MSRNIDWFGRSNAILQTFKPKTGKNKHWFYRHPNTYTDKEKQESATFISMVVNESITRDIYLDRMDDRNIKQKNNGKR
jgi:hypothetical protein